MEEIEDKVFILLSKDVSKQEKIDVRNKINFDKRAFQQNNQIANNGAHIKEQRELLKALVDQHQ